MKIPIAFAAKTSSSRMPVYEDPSVGPENEQAKPKGDRSLRFMNSSTDPSPENSPKAKRVCMIAFTHYPFDGRVRLEAESLVEWGYEVRFLVPKEKSNPTTYTLAGVTVEELDVVEYGGKNKLQYLFAYMSFMVLAFFACSREFIKSGVRIFHVHNMPNILVLVTLIPRLFGGTVILDVHDTVVETYQAKFGDTSPFLLALLRFEEWFSCLLAQRVICVNHVQRESVVKRGVRAEKLPQSSPCRGSSRASSRRADTIGPIPFAWSITGRFQRGSVTI